MEILFIVIGLIFALLQIILFFKIWGMTNDIRDIKEKYLFAGNESTVTTENVNYEDYSDGLLVVELKTEKQMRLGELLSNGKYKCYSNNSYIGDFAPTEFMEFDKWVKEVYRK